MSNYVADGYVANGYVESNPVIIIEPTDNIVNITRSLVLDGADITKYVTEISLSKKNDRLYHTLTFNLREYVISTTVIRNKDKRLVLTIGTDVYSFIIIDVNSGAKGKSSVLRKTEGCLLDKPFSVESNVTIVGNSNEVIDAMCNDVGLQVENSVPPFGFNKGSFLLNGSYRDGIENILEVSGANYFVSKSGINIVPRFRIGSGASPDIIVSNSILADKVISTNDDGSQLVNNVTFNPKVSDIKSQPIITLVTDDDKQCRKPKFLFNPEPQNVSDINANIGNFEFTIMSQEFYTDLDEERIIRLGGAIQEISLFTLDGDDFTDYVFEVGHNVIITNSAVTGAVKIIYKTKGIKFYTGIGEFQRDQNSYVYKAQYLNQYVEANIPKCEKKDENTDEHNPFSKECKIFTNNITKDSPIIIDIENATPNIKMKFIENPRAPQHDVFGADSRFVALGDFDDFFISGITVDIGVVKPMTVTSVVEDVSHYIDGNSVYYGFVISGDIIPTEIMIANSVTTMNSYYDTVKNYKVYYSTQNLTGASVTITYQGKVDRYTIPACGGSNAVKMIDLYSCNTIKTINYPSYNDDRVVNGCVLPVNIVLNVASLLDMRPEEVSGQTISDGDFTYTVKSDGKASITVANQKKYVFDTDTLRKGSEIIVDAENATLGS